jgi:tripartite-type tricarboxylate transporter receptor subunit TctC
MKNHLRRAALLLSTIGLLAGLSAPGAAQDWPRKPVVIVVPYAAGGGADAVARLLANDVSKRLGQPVVVENRPGAGGNVGTAAVARALPDGYTLLLVPPGPIVNSKLLYKNLPYDPDRDLTPIMRLVESPFAVVAFPGKFPDMKSLVAFAKAHPGELNASTVGNGSSSHLLALLIAAETGGEFNIVPYKGTGQMITEIIAGRIDLTLDYPGAYVGHLEAKTVRILATLGSERSPHLPDVPTMKEIGYPAVQASGWFSLHAPRDLPERIVTQVHRAFEAALREPEVVRQLTAMRYSAVPSTQAELKEQMRVESALMARLVRDAKISLD